MHKKQLSVLRMSAKENEQFNKMLKYNTPPEADQISNNDPNQGLIKNCFIQVTTNKKAAFFRTALFIASLFDKCSFCFCYFHFSQWTLPGKIN
jgi:hypothetical protein